ncbi:hypothetical protein FQF17_25255, partial [Escherichia coli]|nr:hypothetical protein [Escherichia coli]
HNCSNGQILGFRPSMGIFSHGYSQDTLLTNEGMADHLWDMFFEPIKRWSFSPSSSLMNFVSMH